MSDPLVASSLHLPESLAGAWNVGQRVPPLPQAQAHLTEGSIHGSMGAMPLVLSGLSGPLAPLVLQCPLALF